MLGLPCVSKGSHYGCQIYASNARAKAKLASFHSLTVSEVIVLILSWGSGCFSHSDFDAGTLPVRFAHTETKQNKIVCWLQKIRWNVFR